MNLYCPRCDKRMEPDHRCLSRRHFFGMLGGAAVTPLFGINAAFSQERKNYTYAYLTDPYTWVIIDDPYDPLPDSGIEIEKTKEWYNKTFLPRYSAFWQSKP